MNKSNEKIKSTLESGVKTNEIKEKAEKILNKLIQDEFVGAHMGSGDDLFYARQPEEYVNKQRKLWIGYGVKVIQECSKALDSLIDEARELTKKWKDTPYSEDWVLDTKFRERIARKKKSTEVLGEASSQEGSMKKNGEE
jgi:hypothetical protein